MRLVLVYSQTWLIGWLVGKWMVRIGWLEGKWMLRIRWVGGWMDGSVGGWVGRLVDG